MPREILELIKWVGVISAIGLWTMILVKFIYNFLFKDIEKNSKG
jgi:hypothetical protein